MDAAYKDQIYYKLSGYIVTCTVYTDVYVYQVSKIIVYSIQQKMHVLVIPRRFSVYGFIRTRPRALRWYN